MRARGPIDFTQGNIVGSMVLFSIPIVLGELFQNLYNSVDALVVGNLVSDSALAAVSVCSMIANLIVNFFNGVSVGSNVVVSHAFGEGDADELRRAVRVVFTFSTLLGVALSVLGIVFAPLLLDLTGALPEYYAEALTYLRIYLAGLMFTVIYNNGAGILRAIGNSTAPFYILVVSCLTNIVLDLVLVAVFHMGVAGIGVAQRLDRFIILPTKSVGMTMTTYVSQNLGAKRYDRVREGARKCAVLALCVTLSLCAVVYIFSEECVALFNKTPEVVSVGVAMMHVLVPFFWCMSLREVILGILRGYKLTKVPMVLSVLGMVAMRQIFLAVAMGHDRNIFYIYVCYPVAWFATLLMNVVYYLRMRKLLPGLGAEG